MHYFDSLQDNSPQYFRVERTKLLILTFKMRHLSVFFKKHRQEKLLEPPIPGAEAGLGEPTSSRSQSQNIRVCPRAGLGHPSAHRADLRHSPPQPLSPCRTSGFDQQGQTSASSTKKEGEKSRLNSTLLLRGAPQPGSWGTSLSKGTQDSRWPLWLGHTHRTPLRPQAATCTRLLPCDKVVWALHPQGCGCRGEPGPPSPRRQPVSCGHLLSSQRGAHLLPAGVTQSQPARLPSLHCEDRQGR